ncbi:MAG: cytochrome C [Gallionellales bacterium RIFCSPHIGHO2_02_FULL_57_16]|nr:MAG: cytochrome C [Gallionellales bacterium RIFCSPHIGHO2_02_FULL_57_16]
MKSGILSMVATASLIIAGASLAADMPAAGKAKCGACHALDKKGVGPSYMDISAKYKGDKDAASKLAAGITTGGSYGWKMSMMPPKGIGANDAEIKAMSEYIAGLAK